MRRTIGLFVPCCWPSPASLPPTAPRPPLTALLNPVDPHRHRHRHRHLPLHLLRPPPRPTRPAGARIRPPTRKERRPSKAASPRPAARNLALYLALSTLHTLGGSVRRKASASPSHLIDAEVPCRRHEMVRDGPRVVACGGRCGLWLDRAVGRRAPQPVRGSPKSGTIASQASSRRAVQARSSGTALRHFHRPCAPPRPTAKTHHIHNPPFALPFHFPALFLAAAHATAAPRTLHIARSPLRTLFRSICPL